MRARFQKANTVPGCPFANNCRCKFVINYDIKITFFALYFGEKSYGESYLESGVSTELELY